MRNIRWRLLISSKERKIFAVAYDSQTCKYSYFKARCSKVGLNYNSGSLFFKVFFRVTITYKNSGKLKDLFIASDMSWERFLQKEQPDPFWGTFRSCFLNFFVIALTAIVYKGPTYSLDVESGICYNNMQWKNGSKCKSKAHSCLRNTLKSSKIMR